jgi:hypothetical protein
MLVNDIINLIQIIEQEEDQPSTSGKWLKRLAIGGAVVGGAGVAAHYGLLGKDAQSALDSVPSKVHDVSVGWRLGQKAYDLTAENPNYVDRVKAGFQGAKTTSELINKFEDMKNSQDETKRQTYLKVKELLGGLKSNADRK